MVMLPLSSAWQEIDANAVKMDIIMQIMAMGVLIGHSPFGT
jgi:hypothetical protein